MIAIQGLVSELESNPHLWWGYHAGHGWVVLDREDVRTAGRSVWSWPSECFSSPT
jgi:hypothetical protein